MALAGLWEHWLGADGSEIETTAILTVPANDDVARIHDRMPVLLGPDSHEEWLDTASGSSRHIEHLLEAAPVGHLEILEMSSKLNNSRSEGPEIQEIVGKINP